MSNLNSPTWHRAAFKKISYQLPILFLKENSICAFRVLCHPVYREGFGFCFGWVLRWNFLSFFVFRSLSFKQQDIVMKPEFCLSNDQGLTCGFIKKSSFVADSSPTFQGFHLSLLTRFKFGESWVHSPWTIKLKILTKQNILLCCLSSSWPCLFGIEIIDTCWAGNGIS